MKRFEKGDTLVFATHNKGKLAELQALLSAAKITARSADALGVVEPEETGTTYFENAALKAKAAASATGFAALGDDSGLSIAALNGAPGINSARWAGETRDFNAAMARVETELAAKGGDDYTAKFVTSLVLATPDGECTEFCGEVEGRLQFPPRGDNGFGYDAIFVPDGAQRTFAQMSADEKKACSHRARAFQKFSDACLPR